MTTGILHLVRHAPVETRRAAFYGPEAPIRPVCREAFQRLAERLPGQDEARWFSSDMMRARLTVEQTLREKGQTPAAGVTVVPGLAEQNFGVWSHRRRRDGFFKKALFSFTALGCSVRPPGGESFLELNKRVTTEIGQLARQLDGLAGVVVTHSGVIQSALIEAGACRLNEARAHVIPHLSVTSLNYRIGGDNITYEMIMPPSGGIDKNGALLEAGKSLRRSHVFMNHLT